ncbi:P-loop containing nucleoside triphosphate hydrolase protein [Lenzites betulinus]|nr:P-loop containing nucleoside triphosphate hydrolase protein [Lenzites betulinus]
MSLLSSTSRIAARTSLPTELMVACIHTSTPLLYKSQHGHSGTAPSRTRLVKDLRSSSGKFEVARDFKRDRAPHHERDDKERKPYTPARFGRRDEKRVSVRPPQSSEDLPRALKLSGPPQTRDAKGPGYRSSSRAKVINPLSEDFDISKRSVSTSQLPEAFTSPPLMEGLLKSVHGVLGADAEPTPIQALALKHLVKPESATPEEETQYRQFLLASETGSGKSMAYLLPVLQNLKLAELRNSPRPSADPSRPRRAMNPRALVLAPTHELSRQLSGFAKELLHNVKLRVICGSQTNAPSRKKLTSKKMGTAATDQAFQDDEPSEILMQRTPEERPVDLLVGTPSKVLELIRGRGWDYHLRDADESRGDTRDRPRRKFNIGQPEMGLADIEWVVVDEADVLFDPDFQEATRDILTEISAARNMSAQPKLQPELSPAQTDAQATPVEYPFNLLLTSATIPSALAAYMDKYHPNLTRLASPNLHRLPSSLKTENFNWTGGNRDADIEHRLRRVWFEDLQRGQPLSRVLIFCNKSARVENLGESLREKGVANVALTRASETRKRGSNHHLDGFLRVRTADQDAPTPDAEAEAEEAVEANSVAKPSAPTARSMEELKDIPHVMITTSLLSRGLDFSPDVKHVFIVDEPRNMIDFLHRAGRSGRAGEEGKVVVFGKVKGRGSEKARVVRRKVGALRA